MNHQEAKKLLLHHSFQHEDVEHPKSVGGFLGMLRPYQGKLIEENFVEIQEIIKIYAEDFQNNSEIDKQVISALWGICHLGKAWAVEPDGMLRSNDLISNADVERINDWINQISYAVMMLLDGSDIESAFEF
jgi:hypothetical protein